jgi:hypothetical protein
MATKKVAAKKQGAGTGPMGPMASLVGFLQMGIKCDSRQVKELTPEQQAALHVFLHEFLAQYFRMVMVVPAARANKIMDKVFRDSRKRR